MTRAVTDADPLRHITRMPWIKPGPSSLGITHSAQQQTTAYRAARLWVPSFAKSGRPDTTCHRRRAWDSRWKGECRRTPRTGPDTLSLISYWQTPPWTPSHLKLIRGSPRSSRLVPSHLRGAWKQSRARGGTGQRTLARRKPSIYRQGSAATASSSASLDIDHHRWGVRCE